MKRLTWRHNKATGHGCFGANYVIQTATESKYFIFRQHKRITKQYFLLYNIRVMFRGFMKLKTKDRLLIKSCGRNKNYFWFSVGSTNGCHIQWLDFVYAYVRKLTKCLLLSASLPQWSIYYFFTLCFNIPINTLLKLAKIHEFPLVITNILENNHWLCSTDQTATAVTRTNLCGRRVFQIVAAYMFRRAFSILIANWRGMLKC